MELIVKLKLKDIAKFVEEYGVCLRCMRANVVLEGHATFLVVIVLNGTCVS